MTIEVLILSIMSVVTPVHTIRIEDWDNLKYEFLSKYCSLLTLLIQNKIDDSI